MLRNRNLLKRNHKWRCTNLEDSPRPEYRAKGGRRRHDLSGPQTDGLAVGDNGQRGPHQSKARLAPVPPRGRVRPHVEAARRDKQHLVRQESRRRHQHGRRSVGTSRNPRPVASPTRRRHPCAREVRRGKLRSMRWLRSRHPSGALRGAPLGHPLCSVRVGTLITSPFAGHRRAAG